MSNSAAAACFTCSRVTLDCLTRVRCTGELDLSAAWALADALDDPLGSSPALVVVDMRQVTFLDVVAAHVLFAAHSMISRAGGRMVIVRGAIRFDWWLERLELDGLVEIVGVHNNTL